MARATRKSCSSVVVDVDGDARGGEDLDGFRVAVHGSREIGGRRGIVHFLREEFLGFAIDTGLLEAAHDLLLLAGVDAAVGRRRGDHGADVEERGVMGDRAGLVAGA